MFWRFGGYANISTIDTLLDKADCTLEELLDESDLIQELKSHNSKLIEFLREDAALEQLLKYVIAPKLEPSVAAEDTEEPEGGDELKGKAKDSSGSRSVVNVGDEEDENEKKRNRYAYVAAEILSSDSWSLSAALLENQTLLRKFWEFLAQPPPLDPLQAGYFTKVNETLLDKKTEEMLELFKSIPDVVKNILQHVDSPMVMDLLLKIISMEKAEGGQGIVDWLHAQDLMPILLSFLSPEHSWATQTSAGDFLKAIITISANASQNEQSCIGPNELTRQLVSQPCVEKLISDMLNGGNPLTVGVGIVIEVIRKNNSDYDPDVGADSNLPPTSRDPIYLGTLLRLFAKHVPDFMELILSPNHTIGGPDGPVRRKELSAAFGSKIEPLGFDRFKTCELMAELLHCSNMGLLNEVGAEEYIKARDDERERLKAEGKLAISPNLPFESLGEDLTMKSSLGSPDEGRRLEVQNASDDDGFEEVTHSGDLGEEPKDDFDEKSEMDEEVIASTKQETSISFLDKDDDEFVDEPLSSPRLHTNPDSSMEEQIDDESLQVNPLSPTKELSQKVSGLQFSGESASSPLPSGNSVEKRESSEESSPEENVEAALEQAIENQQEAVKKADERTDASTTVSGQEPHIISPLPEDKPAPLFAKRNDEEGPNPNVPEPEMQVDDSNPMPESSEQLDTTMREAGDDSSAIVMGNTEDTSNINMNDDTPITPVVGDYLKMQFVEYKVVPTILDFFFRFPWNNFLHNVVYDIVQQVFNGPMDRGFNRTLAIDLFDTGDVTMRIVDGQRRSDEAQEKKKMRLGYMGHLTLIAEEVVKFTERHPPELLSESVLEKVMNGEWITYVEVTLTETRERDNAILGGVRPDMSVGPRQAVMNAVNAAGFGGAASSALADAGLNGGSSLDGMDLANGNGPTTGFGLAGGSLLSGFGSSSDEEDEEMDEEAEEDALRNSNAGAEVGLSVPAAPNLDTHEDEEFSRYITTPSTTTATTTTTTTTTTGTDLDPPHAPPPPPPPLNIPPSRARRQLAARLALHKQRAENAASSSGSVNGGSAADADSADNSGITKTRNNTSRGAVQLLNPFSTDEDDEEEEDEEEDEDDGFSFGGGDDRRGRKEGEGEVTAGDLEVVAEGKGDLPLGTALTGMEVPVPIKAEELGLGGAMGGLGGGGHSSDESPSSSSSSEDDDSDEDVFNVAGIAGASASSSSPSQRRRRGSRSRHRRPSTTEAKRRTSLEDDDEEEEDGEVVLRLTHPEEDEEMVEVLHHVEREGGEGKNESVEEGHPHDTASGVGADALRH